MIQNTPNPFSDYSVITFNLSDNGSTQLDIVDVTGKVLMTPVNSKVLMTPVNSNLSAGTYNITVSAENLASGVYFYVLKHNDRQLVKKMVIAK